jgi:hypothetical protein
VPNTPHTTDEDRNLDEGWSDDDSGVSDRPTVAPPFDLESYAKQTSGAASDVVLTSDKPPRPTPSPPTERAPRGSLEQRIDKLFQAAFEEQAGGARAPSDTAVTLPPPPPPAAPPATEPPEGGTPRSTRRPESSDGARSSSEPMSRRETPEAMQQIEGARVLSSRDDVPRGTGTLLSLANMRIPSDLPPHPQPEDPIVTIGVASLDDDSDLPEEVRAEAGKDRWSEMRERFALGDYSGALGVAESLLEESSTHTEARDYAESCRAVLRQMYMARIGPLNRVPLVEVARDQLRWLSIDHRAGFVLSLVDGVSSLEMILDVSGMPSFDALRILYELVEQRIISLRKN